MSPMIIVVSLVVLVIFLGFCVWILRFYHKVEQGKALIINKLGNKVIVTFTGGVVLPVINKAEVMDISVKAMEINRSGKNGLICEDNIRADISVTFYVRVNKTEEDVLQVAQGVGCQRASTKETLEELFQAKFSEALKTVGKQMEFMTLFTERDSFKERIIKVIGEDLNGYKLEDVAIDYLEQTPLESLDPDNILDAQGIRKIVDLTSKEAIATNDFNRNREKVIKQQDVETREKILELEKQQADAEARQHREIETVKAREQAETQKVQAEEELKAEQANIAKDEEVAVANENKARQIEIALKAKERTIAVETERVERDRQLEAVERERIVAIKDIEKEKAVEVEKKAIQDVIRERVMVEKTVAEEQEKIKDTVELAAARREQQVQLIAAEREAEEKLVTETKAALAKEKAAKSLYEEAVTKAEAEKVRAEKEAEAMKMRANAKIEVESAQGLAQVKVNEAEANAIKLQGQAEAEASLERHKAEAQGTEIRGLADAKAMTAKYEAEAKGIDQKAAAMKKLDGIGQEHEEFKLRLGKNERVEIAAIDVQRQIAEAQAKVLGEAMKTADIDIVGGDGQFLDTFFKSISLAKSIDGFVDKNQIAKAISEGKDSNIVKRLKELVNKEGLKAEDIKNLTVSALLTRLALKGKNDEIRNSATSLQDKVKSLGMDELLALWLAK